MTSKRTAGGSGGPRAVLIAVMVAFAALLAAVGIAAPAAAHSGGKAIVLVRDFTITPTGDAGEAKVHIVDLDSGTAIIAADIKVSVAGGAPAALEAVGSAEPGAYVGKLPKVAPGVADVRLVVRTAPGGEPLALFDRTYEDVTLAAGQEAIVTREVADDGGGSNTGMIVGVAGAVLLVALLYGLFAMRRRGAVPARAK